MQRGVNKHPPTPSPHAQDSVLLAPWNQTAWCRTPALPGTGSGTLTPAPICETGTTVLIGSLYELHGLIYKKHLEQSLTQNCNVEESSLLPPVPPSSSSRVFSAASVGSGAESVGGALKSGGRGRSGHRGHVDGKDTPDPTLTAGASGLCFSGACESYFEAYYGVRGLEMAEMLIGESQQKLTQF